MSTLVLLLTDLAERILILNSLNAFFFCSARFPQLFPLFQHYLGIVTRKAMPHRLRNDRSASVVP